MTGNETKIIRWDCDNRPLGVDVVTGVVDRQNTYYAARLKGEVAWRLFIQIVAYAYSKEVPDLIKACNRAAARKQLITDEERREAALQYCGIAPTSVKAAKPHDRNCSCPPCLVRHVKAGCRIVGCKVCFG